MKYFNHIMSFVQIVDDQSFTKAAKKLSITPTAISKQIKILENYLNQQLLERTTRHITLTEFGEQFYLHAKQLQQQMDLLDNFREAQDGEPQGHLHVVSSSFMGSSIIAKYLPEFHKRYPKIQFELDLAERIPNMEYENIDVVVGFTLMPQIPQHWKYRPLFHTKHIMVASPAYLKRAGVPKTKEDLKNHQWINHPLRLPDNNVVRFKDKSVVYLSPPTIIINNLDAMLQAAVDGLGIVLLVEKSVNELIEKKKLVKVLPHEELNELSVMLFTRNVKYEQPKVRCFVDFLVEKIKTLQW